MEAWDPHPRLSPSLALRAGKRLPVA